MVLKHSRDYSNLEEQFALQRRPYITIANTLKYIYEDMLIVTGLTSKQILPFHYAVIETPSNGIQFFRWLPVYSQQRLKKILDAKDFFTAHADSVYQKIPDKLELDKYYFEVLQQAGYFNDIEFLTAVSQLTYRFPVPIKFNIGLIHKTHQQEPLKKIAAEEHSFYYYLANMCLNETFDLANLPPLRIGNHPFQFQIDKDFFYNEHSEYEFFYKRWYSPLSEFPSEKDSQRYQHIYHLYIPIYDGSFLTQGTLRGYISVFCNNERSRKNVFDYFCQRIHVVQNAINEAFREGTQDSIVDNYLDAGIDPIRYWKHHLKYLQQWSKIEITDQVKENKAFSFQFPYYKISIEYLLERTAVAPLTDRCLLDMYRGQFLLLEIPSPPFKTLGLNNLNINSPYLKKKIKEAVNLLDEILRGYRILKNKAISQSAARKAAVTAIMSRNMSHNIGSHITPRAFIENIRDRLQFEEQNTQEEFDTIAYLKRQLDCYIQKKADFLSEIMAEPLTTTKNMMFYREVILPFIENSLLMDNLTANEGIHYLDNNNNTPVRNRLYIRTFINDQEVKARYMCHRCQHHFIYPNELPYSVRCFTCKKPLEMQLLSGKQDIEVAFPGPLGEYALYSLLENLIRNAAKHHPRIFPGVQQPLVITIAIDTTQDVSYYHVDIYDNLSNPEQVCNQQPLTEWINACIAESMIDEENGNLKRNAWGIAEMKICATLLSGSTDFRMAAEYLVTKNLWVDKKNRLVYHLKMLKPRNVCLISPGMALPFHWKQEGIYFFQSIKALKIFLKDEQAPANFQFALFDASTAEHQDIFIALADLLPKLPLRIIVSGLPQNIKLPLPFQRLINQQNIVVTSERPDLTPPSEKLLHWLWKIWLKRWQKENEEDTHILLYLQQASDESPTAQWLQAAQQFNASKQKISLNIVTRDRKSICSQKGNYLLYDRHSRALAALNKDLHFGDENTYLLLDKRSPDFSSLFHPHFPTPETAHLWTLPYRLAEAGYLRILIVDERMAEQSRQILDNDMSAMYLRHPMRLQEKELLAWHMAWASKVYIVTHWGIDVATPLSYKISTDDKEAHLKMTLCPTVKGVSLRYDWQVGVQSGQQLAADILIIHQGILDQLSLAQNNFLAAVREQIPFVIVDSGRGIPYTLVPQIRFLPFSLLQHYITGKRIGKYNLTRFLMGLSRKKGVSL